MSQRNRSVIIIVAFILLIALTFHAAHARLQTQIAEIESEVSDIRGLERLGETTLTFRARDHIRAERGAPDEEASSPDEEAPSPDDGLERFIAFFRALELAPPELDLEAAFREYYSANVIGYYQFEGEEITILRQPGRQFAPLTFFERLIYAHEYMHVLQDQHYDLKQIWERVGKSENFDLNLATNALIEGDAEAVEWEVLDRLLTRMSDRELDYIIRQAEQGMTVMGASMPMPQAIEAAFRFPYEQGIEFVRSLVESAGWERVHQAFTSDRPQSSEQIYHPERYLAGDAPISISLPDFSEIIGDGHRQVYDSAVGEFYLRQHLMTNLRRTHAEAAASGWGGDRLRIYKNSAADELLWVWHLAWDGVKDASEFAGAYRRFLDLRYERVESRQGCWRLETTRCFARINETETRISMARNPETALALLDSDY
ncbi:MAG: hypothetical protein OXG84_10655 [Chloroflexi bacterium]|nr:hypothetical protein [Chloroflexota bacterium]